MEIKGTEALLVNASLYVKKAVLELNKIPCECTDDIECWRCDLISDTKNLRGCIDDTIAERYIYSSNMLKRGD